MHATERTTVLLRNHKYAEVLARTDDTPPFTMLGKTRDGLPQLWREDGRFREDGCRHPLDIRHVLTPEGEIACTFKP
jgi:hypothetical protein